MHETLKIYWHENNCEVKHFLFIIPVLMEIHDFVIIIVARIYVKIIIENF